MKTVTERLQELGMSSYEARAYIALVSEGEPLNGYEVAKRSGVPRSTVYETLSKLVVRGAAFETRSGEQRQYVALPPHSLLARVRRSFDESVKALEGELPALAAPQETHSLHSLSGVDQVTERALDLIGESRRQLYLSVWPEEFGPLKASLRAAVQRNVDVSILVYADSVESIGNTYTHRFARPETVRERIGCRLFLLAIDQEQVLIAGALDGSSWGMYTDDPAVVLVAVEFVRHDIAMQVLVDKLGEEDVRQFWSEDPTLVRLATGLGAPALRQYGTGQS